MSKPTAEYEKLLRELHSLLSRYGVHHWARVLQDRIKELQQLRGVRAPISGYLEHLARTKQVFGGMGSLNDISLTPQAGYSVPDWVNLRLHELRTALYKEVVRLEAKACEPE